eukprot:TRINITY_DN1651_c0_g1_i1.p1 TRINITY_DN1651_c0_g1~~TRINITY_DN1651_c0_g1_i1.p1  ORF type:complete len:149 (-),score=1.88 TRINITY_DN1651_c0_g1_i1:45-440(-)
MATQETEHLQKMEEYLLKYRVRPTLLAPLWSIGAYGMGLTSALLGKEAAMACTVAVETVIGEHYNDQLRDLTSLGVDDKELRATLMKFRDDELHHLEIGLKEDAEKTPGYEYLKKIWETTTKAAVWVATRV